MDQNSLTVAIQQNNFNSTNFHAVKPKNVLLENHGEGNYYIVIAYDASSEDIKLYNRLKGGDLDEATEK